MDLKNLLIDRPHQGQGARVENKKTVEEIRQGLYKRTGAKTSSEGRTLRSIQVNQKRNNLRAEKLNRGRQIEEETRPNDENKNITSNTGASAARMSRRDKLAEYLRQKKTAQECKSNKSVQPFRCGKVQHPMDTLAALPPIPGSRFTAQTSERRSTVKKIPEARVPIRSSTRQQSKFQASASARSKNMSRDPAPAPRWRMTPSATPLQNTSSVTRKTPLERSSAKKRGQHQTPKQAAKSFAPKHFQFSMNVPMPEKSAVPEVQEGEDETEQEDVLNKTFEKISPEDKTTTEVEVEMNKDPISSPKTPEPKTEPSVNLRSRRSRRISGVQPDPTLTPTQLNKTPAKRVKERSVSCDRRRSLRWIESGLNNLTEEHQHEEASEGQGSPQLQNRRLSRRSLKASIEQVESPIKDDKKEEEEEEHKTPDLKENLAKMPPITMRSTAKRRMSRMSMKVIEEAETETKEEGMIVDMTPISNLTDKIKNAVIESERKEDSFKTPKSSRLTKVKAASERAMRVMSPLSSVTKMRGSSKRKRYSPDAKDSVAALFDNLEGSPLLAKLEAKLKSNENITEADFHPEAPVSKQMRLDKEFDAIADEEKVSNDTDETTSVNVKGSSESSYDVPYFRNLLITETDRLTGICNKWEKKLEKNLSSIEEDIQGEIRTVIGQGRLVMKERFGQFSGLVDNCEFKRGEKETTTTDLMGFWEMIYFQVSDVDKKFGKLDEIEKNAWKEVVVKPTAVKKKANKKPAAGVGVLKKAASSGLRAMIAAKRKAAMANEAAPEEKMDEMKESPVRQSKRKSVSRHIPVPAIEEQASTPAKTESDENQFDGGFFKISSPARQSPSASPKEVLTPSRRSVGGDQLRRTAVLNESHRRSVSGLMLSPFITKVARRSLPSPSSPLRSLKPSSPATGLLVDLVNVTPATDSVIKPIIDDIIDPIVPLSSPVTKTYSKTGVSPAAKQRENDMFDIVMTSSSPRVDEKYFQTSSISASVMDQELISFASPAPEKSNDRQTKKEESTPNQRTRRSSRMRTPMK